MHTGQTLFPSGVRIAVAGGAVWLTLVVSAFLNFFRLSVFDLLFLLAPWVVVPLALNLVPAKGTRLSQVNELVVRYLFLPGAALATASFFLTDGKSAGLLVSLWSVVAAFLALDGLERLIRTRLQSFSESCFAVGEGYSFVGALWLLASRLGMQPVGFHEPIVLLTAVHFHYAGLMAAVLAGLVASSMRSSPLLRSTLACAVVGPGLLGLAFLAGPKLKLAAVGLMVIGECGLAVATFRVGFAEAGKFGGRLLLVGSVCVILGMALAGVWAVGEYPLHSFVNLDQMARYHGVLNSVGFGLCSLVGWNLLRREPVSAGEKKHAYSDYRRNGVRGEAPGAGVSRARR